MKKIDIVCGNRYTAKVSGAVTLVQIKEALATGGWLAMNCATGRLVRIRGAARLRKQVTDKEYQSWLNSLHNEEVINGG